MNHPRRQRLAETAGFAREALLIFVCAIAVRLIHVWQIPRAPFFDVLMGDAQRNLAIARARKKAGR
jgi:hypothetical protein